MNGDILSTGLMGAAASERGDLRTEAGDLSRTETGEDVSAGGEEDEKMVSVGGCESRLSSLVGILAGVYPGPGGEPFLCPYK